MSKNYILHCQNTNFLLFVDGGEACGYTRNLIWLIFHNSVGNICHQYFPERLLGFMNMQIGTEKH